MRRMRGKPPERGGESVWSCRSAAGRECVMSGKKVLVTGGAGFLGSNLCRRLLKEGDEVICLDNLQTGSLENIRGLDGTGRFIFLKMDVTQPLQVACDEIYNLACPASPIWYQKDPVQTMKTSVLGALNMLDLASRCGAKILQASTSEVYGDPLVHPQPENYYGNVHTTGPRSCYDEGKRAAETIFMDYRRMYGTDARIIRIFNTYGPRMRAEDGRVISNMAVEALKGEDLTIYGDGSQTRSFCYVDDLISGMVRMMENESSFAGPVNLGNPEEHTVLELAQVILELTGASSKIVYRPLPADDPVRRKPDITLAEEKLGWKPRVTLRQGLEKTIAYFRDTVL